MQRRAFLNRLTAAGAAALVPAVLCGAGPDDGTDRPNILWLTSEDNHPFLGCYGDALARTPEIDRLAREGVRFEHGYCQTPVCAPSRFALITGVSPAACGPAHHMRAQGRMPGWLGGFPARLREAGYFTTNNSKTDYNAPVSIPDTWDECGGRAHWRNRRRTGQPFFSVFNFGITHESCLFPETDVRLPFEATRPDAVPLPPYHPDTPELRADWARYYDHMALLDRQVGEKRAELEQAGLGGNTIIFYFSDNGGVLPRSKRFLQHSGIHVPLIVYFPPKWRHLAPAAPGGRIARPVTFIDFAPTVLALAGVPVPDYMKGRPFAGPGPRDFHDEVICTRDRMDERYDLMRAAVDGRWLYIRNFRPDLPYVQPLTYMMRARGYQSWARLARANRLTPDTSRFWGPKPAEELYDLAADPHNLRNLAADPAHRETRERLRAALRREVVATVDNGFMPEGSPHEGYDASRRPGVFPVAQVFDLAVTAADGAPAGLPRLTAALTDEHEAMRWWAAQGCTLRGAAAAPARDALVRCARNDVSGAVRVAAAEALARVTGGTDETLPVLEAAVRQMGDAAMTALQALNVAARLEAQGRPLVEALKPFMKNRTPPEYVGRLWEQLRMESA